VVIDLGVDIRCVRLSPQSRWTGSRRRAAVIPLPEARSIRSRIREKTQKERQAKSSGTDFTLSMFKLLANRHSYVKRNALMRLQYLCKRGISPEEIASLFDGVLLAFGK